MDLTYTDANGVEQGVISAFSLDLAFGEDENDFVLTLPKEQVLETGAFVYIDGTEYGGVVRGGEVDAMDEPATFKAKGETWHGLLASRYICPDEGADYFTASGEANAALATVVEKLGLSDVFDVSGADSGFVVSRWFDRYADGYSQIRKMLASAGAKLRVEKEPGAKPTLSAVKRADHSDYESGGCGYRYAYERAVNHLICLGQGELAERTVIHLYADEAGNVTQTQTIFGLAERQAVYDYGNAEDDELLEKGIERLAEMQRTASMEVYVPDGGNLDVGDLVAAVDEDTGVAASAAVSKVIVKIGDSGLTVSYEAGDVLGTYRRA